MTTEQIALDRIEQFGPSKALREAKRHLFNEQARLRHIPLVCVDRRLQQERVVARRQEVVNAIVGAA